MIDVASIVCDYIESHLELPFTISLDLIQNAEKDGSCIRHDPTMASERAFTDGSRLIEWSLALYVRMKNATEARRQTENIIEFLNDLTIVDSKTNTEINCEAVTLAQFIGTDDKEMTTYTASFSARFLQGE